MREIRKIEKNVTIYEKLIQLDPDYTRKKCEEYLERFEKLENIVLFYTKSTQAMFLVLCENNIEEADHIKKASLVDLFIQKINMIYYSWKLNKVSSDISRLRKLEKRVKKVKQRLIQFKYL